MERNRDERKRELYSRTARPDDRAPTRIPYGRNRILPRGRRGTRGDSARSVLVLHDDSGIHRPARTDRPGCCPFERSPLVIGTFRVTLDYKTTTHIVIVNARHHG